MWLTDSLSRENSSPFTSGSSPLPPVDTGDCPTAREAAFADTGDHLNVTELTTGVAVSHTCGHPIRMTAALYTGLCTGLYLGGGMALHGRFTSFSHLALDKNFEKFWGTKPPCVLKPAAPLRSPASIHGQPSDVAWAYRGAARRLLYTEVSRIVGRHGDPMLACGRANRFQRAP